MQINAGLELGVGRLLDQVNSILEGIVLPFLD
jgi:hypothetical protein